VKCRTSFFQLLIGQKNCAWDIDVYRSWLGSFRHFSYPVTLEMDVIGRDFHKRNHAHDMALVAENRCAEQIL